MTRTVTIDSLQVPLDQAARGPVQSLDHHLEPWIAHRCRIAVADVVSYRIERRSLDARQKPRLLYLYQVVAEVRDGSPVFEDAHVQVLSQPPAPDDGLWKLPLRATHDLVRALAAPGGGLPAGAAVVGVAPAVIDTPANRRDIGGPGADVGAWTPPEHIAEALWGWAEGTAAARPASGAVMEARTKAGATSWVTH